MSASDLKRIEKIRFFWENPQMLGFTSPSRAVVMVTKEIVDNSLDACEEIFVLPEIKVEISNEGDVFTIRAEDNGSGIPNPTKNVPQVFGELLFGSKFGVYKQTRGQQGIGISAAFLWSQKTVGEPVRVVTKWHEDDVGWEFFITMKGRSKIEVLRKEKIYRDSHGTVIEMKFKGSWRSKSHLLKYLEGTALANPEADIVAILSGEKYEFRRQVQSLPKKPEEVKPHPHTIDIGVLEEIVSAKNYRKLKWLLVENFSSFGEQSLSELQSKLTFTLDVNPKKLSRRQMRELVEAIKSMKFRKPRSDCLSTIGGERILAGLSKYQPEFSAATVREMSIHDGHPFIIEVGLAYGGSIRDFKLFRVANKVPLVYDESACALTRACQLVNWKMYGFKERDDGLPNEPMVILIHICSTLVPYSTQAKTFVAPKDEIVKEAKLALQEVARKVSKKVKRKKREEIRSKQIEEKLKVLCLLHKGLCRVLEKDVEDIPYESIAKSCGVVFIDDENGVVVNYSNETLNIDGLKLAPGEKAKLRVDTPFPNSLTKSQIDKMLEVIL